MPCQFLKPIIIAFKNLADDGPIDRVADFYVYKRFIQPVINYLSAKQRRRQNVEPLLMAKRDAQTFDHQPFEPLRRCPHTLPDRHTYKYARTWRCVRSVISHN